MTFLHVSDPDWIGGGAACIDSWDLFAPREAFPEKPEGGVAKRERVELALSICDACPMLDVCREWTDRTLPYGSVSGGRDLTPSHLIRPVDPDADAVDVGIWWRRITDVLEDEEITLSAYQRHYLDEKLHRRSVKWVSRGAKATGNRTAEGRKVCDDLLAHPHVRFTT